MNKLLLIFLVVGFLSCTDKESSADGVYFAGEIVNPTSDYVVLYKNDKVVDSAKLDNNNRFAFDLEKIEEGLHHFDHSPQYQYVYLEKGDSLLIRLNASPSYFDESLVFQGDNEEVNNFMIEMFLTHEDEEHLIYSYFKLPPKDFSQKIDSLRNQKLEELALLLNNEEITDNAYDVAKASVDYSSFLYKEKYPFYHKKKTGENRFHELDDSFYGYRDLLDLNDDRLTYFKPYYDFMKHHFGNLSYMACFSKCGMHKFVTAKDQMHLNGHKMAMIDSLVVEKDLKDNLLRNVAMDYLLKVHLANEDCQRFIGQFEGMTTNQEHVAEIKHLYQGIQNLQPDKVLPNLDLLNTSGAAVSLKNIAKNRNTVFYFWTANQKRHFKNVIKRVAKLKQKHPKYQYIGISLKTPEAQWKSMLSQAGLNPKEQYLSTNFESLQDALIVDHLNKCVVSEDSVIVDAFGHLYAYFDH